MYVMYDVCVCFSWYVVRRRRRRRRIDIYAYNTYYVNYDMESRRDSHVIQKTFGISMYVCMYVQTQSDDELIRSSSYTEKHPFSFHPSHLPVFFHTLSNLLSYLHSLTSTFIVPPIPHVYFSINFPISPTHSLFPFRIPASYCQNFATPLVYSFRSFSMRHVPCSLH